jgi:hypothetical protein
MWFSEIHSFKKANITLLFLFLLQPEGAANNNYLVQYALALVSLFWW